MTCFVLRRAAPRRVLLLAAATALSTTNAFAGVTPEPAAPAPSGFEIAGSFRIRGDAVEGQFRPGKAEDDAILMLRTMIFARYTTGPVQFVAELSDARVYGQDLDTPIGTGEVNALEPLQAYVGLDLGRIVPGGGTSGTLRAGRFTMDIGAGRLIGRSEDSNFPSAYTGAALDLETTGGSRLNLFWTMANIRLPKDAAALQDNDVEFDRATNDLQFYGAHYARPIAEGVDGELYAYRLNEDDSAGYPTRNRDLWTWGARVSRAPATNRFDFDFEYAHQTGDIRATASAADATDLDVEAWFVHAQAGRKFAGAWSPRVSLHFDMASGDGEGSSYGRFDPLFGVRRSELGPTSLYGPVSRSNIVTPGIRFEAKRGRFDIMTMYRALWLDQATDSFGSTGVRDAAGASGRWAGNQVELRARYWLMPDRLRLEGGGAWLDKGRFLTDAPNAPDTGDTRYGYLSLSANF